MSNDEGIDFYEENEEEEEINNSMGKYKDNKPKNDKKIKPNAANTLYDGDEEEEEIIERKNKKKKIKETENMKILKELKEEDKKDEKEDDLNNSRDYGEDNEPSEPDFYADEDDGGEENDGNDNNRKSENKNEVKIKQKNIKKEIFDINNIYEINNTFHYKKDSPLFYILEDNKEFNYHPTPLSSKQLVNLIREENIPYDSLQIKLVDLFRFKSKLSFVYVNLKEILKPGWSSDVDYSNIFKELSKLILKDNNIKEEKDNSINVSSIKNENESFSFSLFKNMENDTNKNKKEEKGAKKEDKKEEKKEVKKEYKKEGNNKINRNKKKGRKKGEDIDIKTGFIYDN